MRSDRRLLLVTVGGVVLWTAALYRYLGPEQNGLIDLRVYRTAGDAWLHDLNLYDPDFPYGLGPGLPFTYPPLAAVLFAALTVLPWWLAVAIVTACGLAALAWGCRLAAGWLAGSADRRRTALLATAAVAAAPLLEPVRETVSFGQVNLLLVGLITADCLLRRTPWPRGAVIGLAAAVKLTPAAFLLFFVARRQWRPVLVAAVAFVAAALLGWVLAPQDTRDYWFGALLEPARIGGLEFTSNQSLRGLLHRFGMPAGVESLLWLGLSAVVVVLALVAVAGLRRRGDEVAALLVTAATALLVSPVSWSHHWVWAVVGLLWFGEYVRRACSAPSIALFVLVAAVFVSAPHWWLPYRGGAELHWNLGEHLLGNAYVWIGLAVVVSGFVAARRGGRTPATEPAVPVTAG